MPMTEAIPIEGGPVDGRLREESFSEVIDVEDSKYAASPPTGQSFITIASTGTEQINRGRKICSLPDIAMLPGETVCSTVRSIVHGAVYFTNYRIVFMLEDRTGIAIIPRIAVEYVQLESDEASITVACRNGRMFRISASNVDSARAIHTQLLNVTMEERSAGSLFAFQVAQNVTDSAPAWLKGEPTIGMTLEELQSEFQRLQFGDYWKITDANGQFAMIPTYPEHFIIPKSVPDISLLSAASGRFLGRIPVAVWRDVKSGATLFRSSQPYVPWIGSSNPDEINLYNKCRESTSDATMIIMDARSSTSAHANRMKGGGFEFPQNYFGSDVKFMNLPNIHAVRNGFASYRQTISTKELDLNFYLNIHNCSWLYQIYSIISAAKHCNEYLTSGKNVLVHCSDGWDRTTQIVALAKLLGDAHYRTLEGFELLVRGDWIGFGHKFNDRNSMFNAAGTDNEKCPIFLQWLDCVFQMSLVNPTAFEFNANYLVKIAQHCYSGLFGTFLFNSVKEHNDILRAAKCKGLPSLWAFLKHYKDRFTNVYYDQNQSSRLKVPLMRNLKVWESVYNPNRFEEPLNSANDGISHNFSDLMHSGLIESFYPDNCGRPETIKRSHSEENVSSSVGKPTCSGGPQTSSASQEIPGQRRRSASQVDAFSVCSLDFPSVPQASTSSDASVINSEEQVTPSPETASDRDQQSSIGSEGDQSEPETSSSSSGTSSGTSSRNSVVHRSKKFRLRFGKEKVVDADGLTSIINFEFDNIQLMRSSYEKQILDLEAQVERLKRLCGSKEEDGDRKSKDGDEQSDATVPKTDDEFEMVNTVDSDQGAMQATLAVPEADDLHGFNFHRQFRVRRSTTGSDRSSISGCGAVAYTSDPMDQLNFEMSNCSEASNQLIPMPGSTLRRRQQSTSSTTSFNFHSSGSSGQTVHG